MCHLDDPGLGGMGGSAIGIGCITPALWGGMGSALHHAVPRGALRLRFAPGREHQAWARGVWASAHACDARLLGATMSNALLPNGEVLGDN